MAATDVRVSISTAAAHALAHTQFPAVVIETCSDRILAATQSAAELLDPESSSVVGHRFEEFTTDEPLGALDLFRSGRVTGFEATRVLRRPDGGTPVGVWMHRFQHQSPRDYLLVVLVRGDAHESAADIQRTGAPEELVAVAGTTDESLLIVQVSEGAARLFGTSTESMAGRSLLSLVAAPDRARALASVAEAAETGRGITLDVEVWHPSPNTTTPVPACELLILPLKPMPSCFFVLLPAGVGLPRAHMSEDMGTILGRLTKGTLVSSPQLTDVVSMLKVLPGQAELTSREREVLTQIAAGHRVPAIARALYLSESTIRTHVATTGRKLGTSNQRQLRDLLSAQQEALQVPLPGT